MGTIHVSPVGSAPIKINGTLSVFSVPVPSGTGLNSLAVSKGKLYFGSMTDTRELPDAPYIAIISDKREFGQLTPGNAMKWDATEPSRGTFSFTRGQQILDLAKKNGQMFRGHTCVWHSQLPGWVTAGNFNNATLQQIIRDHINGVVGHWKGQIRLGCRQRSVLFWSVKGVSRLTSFTEAFEGNGTYRQSVFYKTIGPSYIELAFRTARAADPNTKLYINDYNIEAVNTKATAIMNLVKDFKARGVPIDGVGLQAHLIVGAIPSTIRQVIEQFTALCVEVAITELDIRMTLPVTAAKLEQQRKDYLAVIAACKAVKGCVGVTVANYTDRYSWVESTFPGEGAALPWDVNLQKKPAYNGIVSGFA
ncbi:hypothetical protein AX16_006836 [Volvariella volvacea WC 439]|nr:hypothetical protein AX16_006836 [Volvariella volvacea WC 439]